MIGETLSKNLHAKRKDKIVNNHPELKHPQDKLVVKQKMKPKYKTMIDCREDINEDNTQPMPTIICFTNGSQTEFGTGAWFSIMGMMKTKQESIHLGEKTTVYQAEIVATLSASMELMSQSTSNRGINFHIDSQSAVI